VVRVSLRLIEGFGYTHRDTAIHSLDPRTKITYALTVLTLALLTTNLVPLLLLFIVQIPLVFIARIWKKWKQAMQGLLILVLIVIILNAFLPQRVNPYPTTTGIAVAFRICASFTAFNLIFQTIDPDDLAQAIEKLGAPYSFAWTFSTAYRFVPILAEEAQAVREAQVSRGLQIDQGNILSRLKKTLPLLIPLFASALRRAQELAEAMESRAWNPKMKRTYFYQVTMKRADFILTGLSLLILSISLLFNWITPIAPPTWWNWALPPQYELKNMLGSFLKIIRDLLSNLGI